MPKHVPKQNMKHIRNHIFRFVQILKLIVKTMVFEGLACCVRERKRYQQITPNETNIYKQRHQKTMNKSIGFLGSINQTKSVHGAPNSRRGAPEQSARGAICRRRVPQWNKESPTSGERGDHTRLEAWRPGEFVQSLYDALAGAPSREKVYIHT